MRALARLVLLVAVIAALPARASAQIIVSGGGWNGGTVTNPVTITTNTAPGFTLNDGGTSGNWALIQANGNPTASGTITGLAIDMSGVTGGLSNAVQGLTITGAASTAAKAANQALVQFNATHSLMRVLGLKVRNKSAILLGGSPAGGIGSLFTIGWDTTNFEGASASTTLTGQTIMETLDGQSNINTSGLSQDFRCLLARVPATSSASARGVEVDTAQTGAGSAAFEANVAPGSSAAPSGYLATMGANNTGSAFLGDWRGTAGTSAGVLRIADSGLGGALTGRLDAIVVNVGNNSGNQILTGANITIGATSSASWRGALVASSASGAGAGFEANISGGGGYGFAATMGATTGHGFLATMTSTATSSQYGLAYSRTITPVGGPFQGGAISITCTPADAATTENGTLISITQTSGASMTDQTKGLVMTMTPGAAGGTCQGVRVVMGANNGTVGYAGSFESNGTAGTGTGANAILNVTGSQAALAAGVTAITANLSGFTGNFRRTGLLIQTGVSSAADSATAVTAATGVVSTMGSGSLVVVGGFNSTGVSRLVDVISNNLSGTLCHVRYGASTTLSSSATTLLLLDANTNVTASNNPAVIGADISLPGTTSTGTFGARVTTLQTASAAFGVVASATATNSAYGYSYSRTITPAGAFTGGAVSITDTPAAAAGVAENGKIISLTHSSGSNSDTSLGALIDMTCSGTSPLLAGGQIVMRTGMGGAGGVGLQVAFTNGNGPPSRSFPTGATTSPLIECDSAAQPGPIQINTWSTTAGAASALVFAKSHNNTVGMKTAVQTNDVIGQLAFSGASGGGGTGWGTAAYMQVVADGNHSSSNSQAYWSFLTTPNGASTSTERLRIGSSGSINIMGTGGTSSSQRGQLFWDTGLSGAATTPNAIGPTDTGLFIQGGSTQSISLGTNATTYWTLANSGLVTQTMSATTGTGYALTMSGNIAAGGATAISATFSGTVGANTVVGADLTVSGSSASTYGAKVTHSGTGTAAAGYYASMTGAGAVNGVEVSMGSSTTFGASTAGVHVTNAGAAAAIGVSQTGDASVLNLQVTTATPITSYLLNFNRAGTITGTGSDTTYENRPGAAYSFQSTIANGQTLSLYPSNSGHANDAGWFFVNIIPTVTGTLDVTGTRLAYIKYAPTGAGTVTGAPTGLEIAMTPPASAAVVGLKVTMGTNTAAGGAGITFGTGGLTYTAAIPEILGPADKDMFLSAGAAAGTNNGLNLTLTGGAASGTGVGGGQTFTGGAGVGTGGTQSGGGFTFTGGAPAALNTQIGSTAGNAGGFTITAVAGGAATAGTGTGGVSNAFAWTSGTGGANASVVSVATGGASGGVTFTTGAGGAAANATVTGTGGASGGFSFTSGNGGAGATTGGVPGSVAFSLGNAGTGGNVSGANFTVNLGTKTGSGTQGAFQVLASDSSTLFSVSNGNTLTLGASGGVIDVSNATGQIKMYAGTTGAGTPLLGTNSPAVTNTAPYTWLKFVASDGSQVYVPAWK